jgi:hypothetical protein
LENEIKIMKSISSDININFELEKYAKMFLKKVRSRENHTYETRWKRT